MHQTFKNFNLGAKLYDFFPIWGLAQVVNIFMITLYSKRLLFHAKRIGITYEIFI